MSLSAGLTILLLLNILSGYITKIFHINFPSPLLGMIILVVLIQLKILPLKLVEDGCKFLLDNIGLFFVPIVVGVVIYLNVISQNALTILTSILTSTVIIICSTGLAVDYLLRKKRIK